MKLNQLEHLLRAAGAITEEREFYVIGSQAILPSLPLGRKVPQELERLAVTDIGEELRRIVQGRIKRDFEM